MVKGLARAKLGSEGLQRRAVVRASLHPEAIEQCRLHLARIGSRETTSYLRRAQSLYSPHESIDSAPLARPAPPQTPRGAYSPPTRADASVSAAKCGMPPHTPSAAPEFDLIECGCEAYRSAPVRCVAARQSGDWVSTTCSDHAAGRCSRSATRLGHLATAVGWSRAVTGGARHHMLRLTHSCRRSHAHLRPRRRGRQRGFHGTSALILLQHIRPRRPGWEYILPPTAPRRQRERRALFDAASATLGASPSSTDGASRFGALWRLLLPWPAWRLLTGARSICADEPGDDLPPTPRSRCARACTVE